MHEFRRNLDDAILHARRRTMSRWKALTFLQNISANQRDRIPRRDTRRAQTRKLTFFILFFEITCTQTIYYTGLLYEYVKYCMHAYAGPACICRMHAPSMLIPPTQNTTDSHRSKSPFTQHQQRVRDIYTVHLDTLTFLR